MQKLHIPFFLALSLTLGACSVLKDDLGQCVERSKGDTQAELTIAGEIFEVRSAVASSDPYLPPHAVLNIILTAASAKQLGMLTQERVGEELDVAMDGVVLTSPVVRAPILSGNLQISGNMTREESESYAERLSPTC